MYRVPKLIMLLGITSIALLTYELLTGTRIIKGSYKQHKNGGIALGVTGTLHAMLALLSK